jgi:hypothetical protein
MSVEPWINWQFHKAPGLIDPRATFMRASIGRVPNRLGVLSASPPNTGRWRFNPVSGLCEGLLIEPQRTNLLLRSEEFDDAAWTKTSLTVTANSTSAPDGTMAADTLAATGAGGTVAQAVTITAGRGIALSVHARPNASSWLTLRLSDGTNTVEAWFNLAAGAAGSNTPGGGTCVFSAARIEPMGAGWMRASLEVTTNTSTAFTATIAPTASDGAAPASGNSIDAWGAQLEAEAALNSPTSYIPTAGSTVTRSADNLLLPVTSGQVPLDRGTMIFEMVMRPIPPVTGGGSIVLGGIANTFANTVYVSRSGSNSFGVNWISNSTGGNLITRTVPMTPGAVFRLGVTWQVGRIALCVDGGTITSTTLNIAPLLSVARIGVGMTPWSTSATSAVSYMAHRAFLYVPQTVSDALLQQLTAP